ncbi:class I SAM-dependent methyltransferase [Pleionea sp. CnH1-48]|uniref:class I SAM-dependent methyltransferase n=1 Tax=Pleionea sp. CnH1-48 TaxID=2954494 RepID=UPI002096BF86|nr:class I SAM-dependent methyltransferase [Pleionea sp. CnH1-48]MCO7225670.1 class I SAM-dependent methyltransferase [Pleionea sp. CnH1-48]
MSLNCPLCLADHSAFFWQDKRREYYQCGTCRLVFVPSQFHLSHHDEKNEYDKHQNTPEDQGYRKFLSRLTQPLISKLAPAARGLDFGCGPGPTLSVMLEEEGFHCSLYDIYYFPDKEMLNKTYQFITSTEVVEHLSKPGQIFKQLYDILEPGGWLGLMTKRVIDKEAFAKWHYKNDPTHISFFSDETFEWLAERYSMSLEFIASDVVLMRKR